MTNSAYVVFLPQYYPDVHPEVDFASASKSVDSCPTALTRKEHELLTLLVHEAGELEIVPTAVACETPRELFA